MGISKKTGWFIPALSPCQKQRSGLEKPGPWALRWIHAALADDSTDPEMCGRRSSPFSIHLPDQNLGRFQSRPAVPAEGLVTRIVWIQPMTLAATTGICIEFDPRGVGELGYRDTLLSDEGSAVPPRTGRER